MNNKIIYLIVVVIFAIGTIAYMNTGIGNLILPEEITMSISIIKSVDVDKKKIFDVMANVENYPNVLKNNFKSVTIINQTDNVIFTEAEIQERGIQVKLLVKHTIIPYESHKIEILSGDAKGSTMITTFSENNSMTKIKSDVELHLRGILIPFGLLLPTNIQHAIGTVITSFVEYSINN